MISNYHHSIIKKVFNISTTIILLIICIPIVIVISTFIKLTSRGPIIFKQRRVGKNGKVFTIYKFRTMKIGSEKLLSKFKHLNISDGPTFKIPKDPRYTSFGKYLVKTGFDELPQLINVLKGEMALVGPRPLQIHEVAKMSQKERIREVVKPGIVSAWVISGAHNITFKKWMTLDREYIEKASLRTDVYILISTFLLITKLTIKKPLKELKLLK